MPKPLHKNMESDYETLFKSNANLFSISFQIQIAFIIPNKNDKYFVNTHTILMNKKQCYVKAIRVQFQQKS